MIKEINETTDGLMSVRDYANSRGVSFEAVKKYFAHERENIKNHVFKFNGIYCYDADAVKYIDALVPQKIRASSILDVKSFSRYFPNYKNMVTSEEKKNTTSAHEYAKENGLMTAREYGKSRGVSIAVVSRRFHKHKDKLTGHMFKLSGSGTGTPYFYDKYAIEYMDKVIFKRAMNREKGTARVAENTLPDDDVNKYSHVTDKHLVSTSLETENMMLKQQLAESKSEYESLQAKYDQLMAKYTAATEKYLDMVYSLTTAADTGKSNYHKKISAF